MASIDLNDKSAITEPDLMIDTGARNMPDGFPCLVYLNGDFYGIYAFQLKKHRKNMHQEKDNPKHIHLDSGVNAANLFGGTVNWDWVEVRNPSKLYCMDGTKYDGDDNRKELIDSTSPFYDSSKADYVKTDEVKSYILRFAGAIPELKTLDTQYKSNPTDANLLAIRQKYEQYFDVDNQIDYLIFCDIVNNWDGISNNAQWCTYDGNKWFVCPYDLDNIFNREPLTTHISDDKRYPWYYVIHYYTERMESRYKELRDKGIISTQYIVGLVDSWVKAVGLDNYEQEANKWPGAGKDNLPRLIKWMDKTIENMDIVYNYS
jgi:hypothetical protein